MRYLFVFLVLFFINCGTRAASESVRAEQVAAPLSGYTCFVIKNAANEAVGGNCVRD